MPSRKTTSLGDLIVALRQSRGLKQKDLAEKAGISQGMVSHIEKGKYTNLHVTTIKRLEDALGDPKVDLVAAVIGKSVDSHSLDAFLASDLYKELREPLSQQEIAELRASARWYPEEASPSPYAWLRFVEAWRLARRTATR